MSKVVMITGSGQDSSYLTELLLERGDKVVMLIRRASYPNTQRVDHIPEGDNFIMDYFDLSDTVSIENAVQKYQPDIIFNMAAQSHVGISFKVPESTINFNTLGVLRFLEAIKKIKPSCKFYQASSSEMFGISPPPQNENTPFMPCSPYGVSKLAAFHLVRTYREGYGLFATNGILFNHESVPKNSSLIVRGGNMIDILPIEDLFRTEGHRYEGLLDEYYGKEVWNGDSWTTIEDGSCYQDKHKEVRLVQTRDSSYEATLNHVIFSESNNEIPTHDVRNGLKVFKCKYPEQSALLSDDLDLAKFIGFVVGDGCILKDGRITLSGVDKKELEEIASLICNKYGWTYKLENNGVGGFENCTKDIWKLNIHNDTSFGLWLRKQIYTLRSSEKRVPKYILNSNKKTKKAFFDGYYLADGRKKGHERYYYKGFTTASQTLCLGLNYLFRSFSTQTIKSKCEYREGRRYYYVQFGTPSKNGKGGNHLMKEMNEVISITNTKTEDGWFFDIQTTSKTFSTGPNLFKVHNSERRGLNFVTRKITRSIAEIVTNKRKNIELGNIDATRDWGHSRDYMKAIIELMELENPTDTVISTGETYSVRDFLKEAFGLLGLNWEDYVTLSDKQLRPFDVPSLLGDNTKALNTLKWRPRIMFKELVREMLDNDLREQGINGIEEAKEVVSSWEK